VESFRLFAATGDAVAQLDSLNGESADVSLNLEGRGVMCMIPRSPFWLRRERSWGEGRPRPWCWQ
jgi:hypothetical protein